MTDAEKRLLGDHDDVQADVIEEVLRDAAEPEEQAPSVIRQMHERMRRAAAEGRRQRDEKASGRS